MRKTTKCFLLGLLAAKLGGAAYIAARLKLSLPTTGGELSIPCLDSPVEVIFDRAGIPHITAQSELDAFRALG